MQSKGKRKVDKVKAINFEEMAKNVLSQTKKNQVTIENKVQKKIDAQRARNKSRVDQVQEDEELWGHTLSAEDQGIPQTSYLESADNLLFPP